MPDPKELRELRDTLRSLFQLDAADLDFGMYRVLALRAREIELFLGLRAPGPGEVVRPTLLDAVRDALGADASGRRTQLEKELAEVLAQMKSLGVPPEASPRVSELRGELAKVGDDDSIPRERRVYALLGEFFSRYYDEGDFLSLQRLSKDTFAVPYNGAEVVLHWANKDQYYVKSGEYFGRYAFVSCGKRIVFRIVHAETDPDNVKTDASKKRVFQLRAEEPVVEEDGELVCQFEYVPSPKKQPEVNAATLKRIEKDAPKSWDEALSEPPPAGKKSEEVSTILAYHLRQYTEKNKRDYFVHKDLKGFLRGELDRYLKNEVLSLDVLDARADDERSAAERKAAQDDSVRASLALVRAVRAVALPVIDFLASLEDFQKRLFLKQKLVLRTDWAVSLERIPAALLGQVAEKATRKVRVSGGREESQVERWTFLFGKDALGTGLNFGTTALTAELLRRRGNLILETRYFDEEFKHRLLAEISKEKPVDAGLSGVMIRGENFQALRLLTERYRGRVQCVYIDPPYNAKTSEIPYKNSFKHSAWLSLMQDRLLAAKPALASDGVLITAIDENEHDRMAVMFDTLFPAHERTSVSLVHNPRGIQGDNFSYCHEYAVFVYPAPPNHIGTRSIPQSEWEYTNLRNWGGESLREDGKSCFYPIFVKGGRVDSWGAMPDDDFHPKGRTERLPDGRVAVWPIDPEGVERKWRYARETLPRVLHALQVVDRGGAPDVQIAKTTESIKSLWSESKHDAGSHGKRLLTKMGVVGFDFPKAVHLPADCISAVSAVGDHGWVLDFFGGSGTTGHAVTNLNRQDPERGRRRFLLVEVNDYFDTVLVPRNLKAAYAAEWSDGAPSSHATGVNGGVLYKVMYLESYEDSLLNVQLPPDAARPDLLTREALRREYMISYMIDQETRQAVLDLDRFARPFDYTIGVRRGGETWPEHPVDLVETFNYLIGLTVERTGYDRDPMRLRFVEGAVLDGGRDVRVLVVWRDCTKVSNEDLLAMFGERGVFGRIRSPEFERVYVNGDPPLENVSRDGAEWKVRAIESEFKRLLFAREEV